MNYQTVYAFLSDKKQSENRCRQTCSNMMKAIGIMPKHIIYRTFRTTAPKDGWQMRKDANGFAHYADSDVIRSEYRDLRDEPAPENDYERHPLAGFVEGATGF